MDWQLVTEAQRGDRAAFGRLAAACAGRLYALAYRILRDNDLAEDAAQEAIVSIWRDLPSLRDPDRFDVWAHRIVVRACYRELRRRRTDRAHLRVLPDATTSDGAASLADRDELDRAFRRLTAEHRAVVALQFYVGMTHPEIAEVLDIPVGTVGSRVHAAKRALRAALEADARRSTARGRAS